MEACGTSEVVLDLQIAAQLFTPLHDQQSSIPSHTIHNQALGIHSSRYQVLLHVLPSQQETSKAPIWLLRTKNISWFILVSFGSVLKS